jgi:hypothetical protein
MIGLVRLVEELSVFLRDVGMHCPRKLQIGANMLASVFAIVDT